MTPAELHNNVTKTIRETARACDIEDFGMEGWVGQCPRAETQRQQYTRLRYDNGVRLPWSYDFCPFF